jgi:ATP-dependent HslUV protease subunit HslV
MITHGTTILAVRHQGRTAVAGDGQVTLNASVIKHTARKVRRIYNDRIIVGFAGATADALSLSERLQEKLERYNGNLTRAAAELARDWRTDKSMRRLEAVMVAVDATHMYLVSGNGDVIEPDEGVIGIGSGGTVAQAAAVALLRHTGLDARRIAEEALGIAASICIYTNDVITIEEM